MGWILAAMIVAGVFVVAALIVLGLGLVTAAGERPVE